MGAYEANIGDYKERQCSVNCFTSFTLSGEGGLVTAGGKSRNGKDMKTGLEFHS